jgi:hypothetical protein
MAAFKQFNSEDIVISPLEVNKSFTFKGNELTGSDVVISRYLGKNKNFLTDRQLTGISSSLGDFREYQVTVYNSIKQLYYSNYISGSGGETSPVNNHKVNLDNTISPPRKASQTYQPSYYNYPQTDLNPYKYFPTSSGETIGVLAIPKNLFGDYIQPNSIKITTESGSYIDDGEGRLKRINPTLNNETFVGNIIYQHGMIILTGGTRKEYIGETDPYGTGDYGSTLYGGRVINSDDILNFVTGSNVTCSFSSSFGIYETQYKCTMGESEFNFTLNPSIVSSSYQGSIFIFATSSYFDPYVTTVGMYNEAYELVAVGKLGKTLPTSRTTDTTILVNIDRQ